MKEYLQVNISKYNNGVLMENKLFIIDVNNVKFHKGIKEVYHYIQFSPTEEIVKWTDNQYGGTYARHFVYSFDDITNMIDLELLRAQSINELKVMLMLNNAIKIVDE